MRENKGYGRFLYLLLIAAFAALFTGCGEKSVEGYYEASSIKEDKTTIAGDALDDYGLKDSYIVFEGTKGYLVFMDTVEDFTYDASEKVLKTSYGPINADVGKKKITISDDRVKMVFKKSDDPVPDKPSVASAKPDKDKDKDKDKDDKPFKDDKGDEPSGEDDGIGTSFGEIDPLKEGEFDPAAFDWESFDYNTYDWAADPLGVLGFYAKQSNYTEDEYGKLIFWNGDWYGWWEIDGWTDEWKKLNDYKFDIMANTWYNVETNEAGIRLWDNDTELGLVNGDISGGLFRFGNFRSEEGYFYKQDIAHADWMIDPGMYDHLAYLQIEGRYRDENDDIQFDYTIHLVKWGYRWEDFEEEELPNHWDWYTKLVENGDSMPETMPED